MLRAAPLWFARSCSPSNAEIGEIGERLAANFLRARGLVLLARRAATARGEIDLVALDRGRLVCVEVKTSLRSREGVWRPGDRWRMPAYTRQRKAARLLAAQGLGRRSGAARLDLVEVWIGPRESAPRIHHHQGLAGPLSSGP